eukprot:Rhum_TRINITY_DN14970_c3_g2::Rhum_TRINITY_DN14970_c3_g2_i1::g.130299::m.130299
MNLTNGDPWGDAPASGGVRCTQCGRLVAGNECEVCGAPSASGVGEETNAAHVASSPVGLHEGARSLPSPPPQPQPQANRPPSPPPAPTRDPRARPPPAALPDAWVCVSCTLENEGASDACVACDVPKVAQPAQEACGAWTCSRCCCNTNGAQDAVCSICHTPRHSRSGGGGGGGGGGNGAAERRVAPPRPQPRTPPPSWKCAFCDFKNEDLAEQVCLVCTGARPNAAGGGGGGSSYAPRACAPAAAQKAREKWACARCTFLNEAGSYSCETCGGPP